MSTIESVYNSSRYLYGLVDCGNTQGVFFNVFVFIPFQIQYDN